MAGPRMGDQKFCGNLSRWSCLHQQLLEHTKPGYACISSDGAGVRRVRTALTAGDAPTSPLLHGECARINTGAALPAGADCVVQVEDTKLVTASENGQVEIEVDILVAPKPQQDVRPIGFDIPMGTVLVDKDVEFTRRYRFNKNTIALIIDLDRQVLQLDSRGCGTTPELQVLTAIRCCGRPEPIHVPTAGAQAFPMDEIGRLGHDPPRGPSADWWVLTTADAAGTNGN
ncbi:hypothetical protein evm_013966 [Chilo suppressalis]|nr:hypothetical protein evm_013966 [Chilo suppressalis]